MKWPIRELLNPVVTRSLLYGVNPFDLEYVLKKVDKIEKMSGREIQSVWLGEWDKKIKKYLDFAEEALKSGSLISAREYTELAVRCCYACYMINTDDIPQKKAIYNRLSDCYLKYTKLCKNRIEYVEIPTKYGIMPAYLHFPLSYGSKEKLPCVITYSGVGSCKEELEMLAKPLTERGMAVLTPDMPGTGAALFDHDLKCRGLMLESAFDAAFSYLENRDDIDSDKIGHFGLCMGGGYAFRAASKRPESKCCVSLFPLFINIADIDSIPIWMKRGKWSALQYGESETFLSEIKMLEEGNVSCDFLMVYSEYDNWMSTDASLSLYEKAIGFKEKIFVDEKPAYVSEETIMHAMPVGEQFHWIKHKSADFIAKRLVGGNI